MSVPITPKQFLEQNMKLTLDVHSTRKFQSGKLSTTYYIPIRVNKRPLSVQFHNQILASSAKAPNNDPESKFLNIAFKRLSADEIPYSKGELLEEQNHEFINMLSSIESQFIELAEALDEVNDKYKLPNNYKVSSFSQTTRMDQGEEVELETPIYRVRLPLANGKCGTSWDNKFKSNVVDVRTKQPKELTIEEAKNFITYQSLTAGVLSFEALVISKQGVSLRINLKHLCVMHKPITQFELDIDGMQEFKATDEPEAEVVRKVVHRVKRCKWPHLPGSSAEKPPRDTDSEDQSDTEYGSDVEVKTTYKLRE